MRKLNIVIDYNYPVNSVDKTYPQIQNYVIAQNGNKKYYRTIISHLLEIYHYNFFIMHQKNFKRQNTIPIKNRKLQAHH